jgi:hypothetical protein
MDKKPGIVNPDDYSLWQRSKAVLGFPPRIDGDLYLGYCSIHKIYYLDYIHTNGSIRCPTCDAKWLAEHLD